MICYSEKWRWSAPFILISLLCNNFDTANASQQLRHDKYHDCLHQRHRARWCLSEYPRVRRRSCTDFIRPESATDVMAASNTSHDDVHEHKSIPARRRNTRNINNNHSHRKSLSAAFISNNHNHSKKTLQSILPVELNLPQEVQLVQSTSSQSKQSPTTTSLHLKFQTFDEMITHHHSTPLLIDFYSPVCGPCKLMKGEITSIRSELELLGPVLDENDGLIMEEDEEEDCQVEDVIAVSSACLEDGYVEQQQKQQVVPVSLEETSVSENDPSRIQASKAATTDQSSETINTTSSKQSPAKSPSGIPVYHVNTNKFPQVGAKNRIAGLPTLILFYRGQEIWRNEGLMRGEEILRVLRGIQEHGWKSRVVMKEEEEAVVVGEKKKLKGRRLGG